MAASITITRNKTLPNSSDKSDFHDLVDTATASISGIDQTDLASGVGTVIRQTTTPSDTDLIWVDTSVTPYVVRIYDGTEWVATGGYVVMTNKSGGQRVLGDVCVIDGTTTGAFTTTTTQCDPKQVVVVMETIDSDADGVVATSGARVTNLKMEGACKPGDWIATASTAVKGVVSGVNTFACALASLSGAGTLAEALLSNKGVSPSNVPTEGQFLKQGASVPAWAALSDSIKVKVYTFSRAFNAGTGDVALTGLGATGRALIISGGANEQDVNYSPFPGFAIGSGATDQVYQAATTSATVVAATTGKVLMLHTNVADGYDVTVKSMDADGATLTFTAVGTPATYTWSGTIILFGW